MGAAGGSAGGEEVAAGAAEAAERWERSARFWMRAYPPRWRVVRGVELVGLLADLAGPGAPTVGAREALGLLRGGWATRWREHPPLLPWLGYRLAGRRLPGPFLAWARDDIEGALFGVRAYLSNAAWIVPFAFAMGLLPRHALQFSGVIVGFAALNALFLSYRQRRRVLLKHLEPRPGDHLYGGRLVVQDGPRVRTDARSGLVWLAGASGLLLAGALLAIGARPALVLALVGSLVAVLAVGRVRRQLSEPVDQPDRLLRPVGLLGAARTIVVVGLCAVGLGFEMTGHLVMLVSPVLALVTPILLAASLVGLTELRRAGAPEAAVIDVLRAALLNRPPAADVPVPDVGRAPDTGIASAQHLLGGPHHPALPV